ncbi:MAG TPA: C4-type zinc ribbon domain-containing protein [Fimbriimonas sp.]|nr:C4-type zinc ribbon domain-containing protein [Fimbriimonas sp.]
MASPEISRLWKLAQVDRALAEIRVRAAALDVGQKIQAEITAIEKEEAEVGGTARSLRSELADLELQQKSIDDKIKRIDKELYGGKIVNPREVENFEKEIAGLKKQRGKADERILELWELLPPAEAAASGVQKRLEDKKQQLAERRKKAVQEKGMLEADYKKYTALRPELAEAVKNPTLLARYDSLRQRHSGLGMAEVTRKQSCGVCGTNLPERTIQMLKDDKLVTCESCHRILYYTEGIV